MFKVGDTGVTRDGRRYEVTEVGGYGSWPVEALIDGGVFSFALDGCFWGASAERAIDLMPPTGRIDPLTAEQPRAATEQTDMSQPDRAALVELSSRVLAALCASNGHDDRDADGCARWAVAAARALLRECGA